MHSSVLPTPVGPEEQERADRAVGVLQAGAGAPDRVGDGLERVLLADDPRAQRVLHAQELLALALHHPVDRDAGPAGHHGGDVLLGDVLAHHALRLLRLGFLERLLHLRQLAIGDPPGLLEVAAPLGGGELVAQPLEILLELGHRGELALLGLPLGGQLVRALLELGQLLAQPPQPILGGLVVLLLERPLLDPQLHDAPVELVDRLGLAVDRHALPGRRLVDQVDRLVGQEAVGDVAVGQRGCGDDRTVGDRHLVVDLVALLQPAQDRDRVVDVGLADEHRLEAAGECRVLLDVLAVFVQRGGADAVQLAAGQGRLEHVRGVHRPFGLAGAHERVQLVDEQDDVALAVLHLAEQGLEPLLELATVFRPGDQGTQIEREQAAVAQRFRHVAVDDAAGEALGDRGLADARLADQHRVVLGPARQHLDDPANLLVAADHRVELAGARGLGQVAGVLLECVIALLGARGLGGAALAQLVDRLVQRLGLDARGLQRLAGVGGAHGQRQQQLLDGDVGIAGLLRRLLGLVEQPRGLGRHVELARSAALDLGLLLEQLLDCVPGELGVAARRLDQVRGHALGVVQQHLEHVLGQKALMPFAQGQPLRRLQEPLDPIGVLFRVHVSFPLSLVRADL